MLKCSELVCVLQNLFFSSSLLLFVFREIFTALIAFLLAPASIRLCSITVCERYVPEKQTTQTTAENHKKKGASETCMFLSCVANLIDFMLRQFLYTSQNNSSFPFASLFPLSLSCCRHDFGVRPVLCVTP